MDPPTYSSCTAAGGGLTTSVVMRAPARYRICDSMMTATQSAPNKIAGCGTLLPARSIRSSMLLGFFSALTSEAGPGWPSVLLAAAGGRHPTEQVRLGLRGHLELAHNRLNRIGQEGDRTVCSPVPLPSDSLVFPWVRVTEPLGSWRRRRGALRYRFLPP